MKNTGASLLLLCCLATGPAVADETAPAPHSALPPPPAAASVVAPTPPAGAAQPGYFPPLPPSRPCAATDVSGIWKLQRVFENPVSQASTDFSANPSQYVMYKPDNTYVEYRSSYSEDERALPAKMNAQKTSNLQQFVVHDTGFVYFYRDSIAIDTQACFIVANATQQFPAGQMLLMPPEGQSTTRLVKSYQRVGGPPPAAATISVTRSSPATNTTTRRPAEDPNRPPPAQFQNRRPPPRSMAPPPAEAAPQPPADTPQQ